MPLTFIGSRSRLRTLLAARLDSHTYLGLHLTIGLVIAALGTWGFSALIDAVFDRATLVHWDLSVADWIHARVTPRGLSVAQFVSFLGSPSLMSVLGVVGGIVLWLQRRRTVFVAWVAAFVGWGVIDRLSKVLVHRARPVYGLGYLHGMSYSFPSGHAMASCIGYGMLAYVISLQWRAAPARRAAIWIAAAMLVLAVGASRVYLGVHYPSDVLGAFTASAAWLAVCASGLALALHRQRSAAGTA